MRRFHISGSALILQNYLQVQPLLEPGPVEQLQISNPLDLLLSTNLGTQETQGILQVTPRFTLRLGHRFESKEIGLVDTLKWRRNLVLWGAAYHFSRRNHVAVDYELGRTDQPLLRTDTVDFRRIRLRGRLAPSGWLEAHSSFTLFNNDNDLDPIDFFSRQREFTLQVIGTPSRHFSVWTQYERSRFHTSILYLLPQTLTPDRFGFLERGEYGALHAALLLPGETRLNVGYAVWGTTGNFPLNYHRPVASLEVPVHRRLTGHAGWNYYDYNEKVQIFPQHYRAHLVTVGLRFRLDSGL